MKANKHVNLGNGIYGIDARYICPGNACCYLMIEGDQVAIIETGTARTAEAINEALISLRFGIEAVRYIIPTHVHLDHAGGAGVLMERYPNAQLAIHPRGARHMINPDKLIEGSKAVYGEEKFTQFYGEIIPVSADRVLIIEDGEKLYVANRVLEFRHTPGHAEHHFCIWDQVSQGWFSGDTFGISYASMASGLDRFIIPTTSPVQFDPDRLLNSIELLMSYDPKKFFLTHYSVIEEPEKKADLLREQIECYREIAHSLYHEPDREQKILLAVKEMTLARISSALPGLDVKAMEELLELDFSLNAQGINIWISKQEQKNKSGVRIK